MKTPEQIARETFTEAMKGEHSIHGLMVAAIEADRAQRQPEIYIVQNDTGDVVDVFRDLDEAREAYPGDGYSVITETVWETGEWREAQAQEGEGA